MTDRIREIAEKLVGRSWQGRMTSREIVEFVIRELREPTPKMLRQIRNPWGDASSFAQDCAENGYYRGIDAVLYLKSESPS
jgi:hypothetical protein